MRRYATSLAEKLQLILRLQHLLEIVISAAMWEMLCTKIQAMKLPPDTVL